MCHLFLLSCLYRFQTIKDLHSFQWMSSLLMKHQGNRKLLRRCSSWKDSFETGYNYPNNFSGCILSLPHEMAEGTLRFWTVWIAFNKIAYEIRINRCINLLDEPRMLMSSDLHHMIFQECYLSRTYLHDLTFMTIENWSDIHVKTYFPMSVFLPHSTQNILFTFPRSYCQQIPSGLESKTNKQWKPKRKQW